MALRQTYALLCEFARMEAGGKWIIIGLFPNGIGTPMIPFPLPTLTFFHSLHADSPGIYKFNAKLRQLDTGTVVAAAQGQTQVGQVGPVIIPIAIQNVQFKAFGSYTWEFEVEGHEEPFLMEFQVAHVPMQIRMIPPGMIPPGGKN